MSFTFTSGQGTADNVQAIFERLQLQQSLNVEYELNLTQPLGLTQLIAGPVQAIASDTLSITQLVTPHFRFEHVQGWNALGDTNDEFNTAVSSLKN